MNKTDNRVRFTLRIPEELHAKIKASAEKNKRTIVREIEFILEAAAENIAKEKQL